MTVLIAGASGIVGQATLERFGVDGWDVIALSRRRPACDGAFRHVAVDLRDAGGTAAALGALPPVTHLVYAALYEQPGLIAGWQDPEQQQTNLAMLRNLLAALPPGLRHVSLLQGAKAYGGHVHHPARIPSKEREPRDPHPNFYWLQEDLLRAEAAAGGFGLTILRPQLILGGVTGVAMNVVPVLGVYAAICRELGLPFGFPGGRPYVWEAVDTRLVADALRWAATAPAARGETFNITNGDVFEWRDLWPGIADALGVAPGPDRPCRLGTFLPTQAHVWDAAVRRHGLRPTPLPDLLGESHHYADKCFDFGAEGPPPFKFLSTIKLRKAGFAGCADTEETLRYWLDQLTAQRVVPGAAS